MFIGKHSFLKECLAYSGDARFDRCSYECEQNETGLTPQTDGTLRNLDLISVLLRETKPGRRKKNTSG